MNRLQHLMKTTAVRLTLVYTVLFGMLAVGVVAYVSYNTGRLILSQIQTAVDEEVAEIARFARRGGLRRLIPSIERRSRRPGANLYLVSDANGRIIAGNVRDLDRSLLETDGWRIPPFDYLRFDDEDETGKAIARVFTLRGGLRLLVGRDIGDAERFREIIVRASTLSLIVMVLTGLLLWFFVGRRALKHIDLVSRSSQRIIAGDLSQRLPISGAGDEFDRLSTSLNQIISRVERLNTGVTVMSDSIAHDLKTPLTRLRNRAEAALAGKGGEQAFQEILDQADSMIKTFDALLMISQVESGARTVALDPHDLSALLNDVKELYEAAMEERGIEFSGTISPGIQVNCNRELIIQAISNLLDNALKYGVDADQSVLELALHKTAQGVSICVSDNGNGIPDDQKEAVLQRFVRLDKSRSLPGSGLGLSLVKAVVDLHSGQIELKDNLPGLRVEIRLPLSA